MQVVYAPEEAPQTSSSSIFLAGPSPRQSTDPNWRKEAIQILERLGYDGVVFAPIWREGVIREKFTHEQNYDEQVEWETQYLNQADLVVFWVPRDMRKLPGLTTNVEYGLWVRSGKTLLGYPEGAEKMNYLETWALKEGVPVHQSLYTLLEDSVRRLGAGAARTGGERDVPLHLWKKPEFQTWLACHKAVGNRLDGAEAVWTFRVGKNKERVFLWALHCNIWIASEGRAKTNEVVVFRPDISTIIAFCRPDTKTFVYDKARPKAFMEDTEIVLVREFRTPANNELAMVVEVPGGSSFKPGIAPETTAAEEMHEETGLQVSADRFVPIGVRQLAATWAAHKAHVYAVELTPAEMLSLKWEAGKAHGNEADTERTFVEVTTLGDLFQNETVDWSNLGMIFQALYG